MEFPGRERRLACEEIIIAIVAKRKKGRDYCKLLRVPVREREREREERKGCEGVEDFLSRSELI